MAATVTISALAARGGKSSDMDPDALPASLYLPVWRPWLALYNSRVRTSGQRKAEEVRIGSIRGTPLSDVTLKALAPIQALLPEELLIKIMSLLPVRGLAVASCVCQQWRAAGDAPSLWRSACLEAFANTDLAANTHILKTQHKGRWRSMYLDRPHMRFDGIYVSRNTYIKRGIVEWHVKNACHVVCYYRYFRFFPDNTLLYRTSPEVLRAVARSLAGRPQLGGSGRKRREEDGTVSAGRWFLNDDKLLTKVVYPNCASTEIRALLRLRSTTRGARNRLDLVSLTSFDRAAGSTVPLEAFNPDAEDNDVGDAQVLAHNRGMTTFVFVPFDQVNTSDVNKGIDEMDVWVPG